MTNTEEQERQFHTFNKISFVRVHSALLSNRISNSSSLGIEFSNGFLLLGESVHTAQTLLLSKGSERLSHHFVHDIDDQRVQVTCDLKGYFSRRMVHRYGTDEPFEKIYLGMWLVLKDLEFLFEQRKGFAFSSMLVSLLFRDLWSPRLSEEQGLTATQLQHASWNLLDSIRLRLVTVSQPFRGE